ncbi:hypothetical protein MGSAQ_002842 [marine sediment metagenome]|uniref:Uncharacterized protein n=1 Tax=marine sediment metagenome TaxID=412755 RepID=A0A1B6NQM5_9ZZZZ
MNYLTLLSDCAISDKSVVTISPLFDNLYGWNMKKSSPNVDMFRFTERNTLPLLD